MALGDSRRTQRALWLPRSGRTVLRRGVASRCEVLDFECNPALDIAALPISPPGRHFFVANLT
jgi:hypothetical protein